MFKTWLVYELQIEKGVWGLSPITMLIFIDCVVHLKHRRILAVLWGGPKRVDICSVPLELQLSPFTLEPINYRTTFASQWSFNSPHFQDRFPVTNSIGQQIWREFIRHKKGPNKKYHHQKHKHYQHPEEVFPPRHGAKTFHLPCAKVERLVWIQQSCYTCGLYIYKVSVLLIIM